MGSLMINIGTLKSGTRMIGERQEETTVVDTGENIGGAVVQYVRGIAEGPMQ